MLKVLIYGYLTNLYSSRKIDQALHQNIHFMWLSGMSYPDHNTINRFRRFMLRGSDKVEIEAGLLALAHNLAKMAN
jgi:transposase